MRKSIPCNDTGPEVSVFHAAPLLIPFFKCILLKLTSPKTVFVLIAFSVFNVLNLNAQSVDVLKTETLETTTEGAFFHPVFSPDGAYILCTGIDYIGLRKISLANKTVTKLTDAHGAGYRVAISDDGTAIMHRHTQMVKNLKHNSLKLVSLSDNSSRELIAPTREQFTPAFAGKNPVFVRDTKLIHNSVPAAQIQPVIQIEDRKMVIYNGSRRTVFAPNGDNESYIWPSFSPDGKHIVYTVAAKGTFVCTATGKNVQLLGKLSAPKWLNNNIVIGMDDKYFGQELISSEIIAVSIDGRNRQILAGDKAIYPAASSDGSKIAFSNNEGQLFIMSINIK